MASRGDVAILRTAAELAPSDRFAGPRLGSLTVSERGLQIAATCQIAQLFALAAPSDWTARPLIDECCKSFLSSFKIWNTATVGGNICMSLPAGPMISLAAALEGVCLIRQRDGGERNVAIGDFVTGNHKNVLQPGDLLRSLNLPVAALRKRSAFRRISLTHLGRSAALLAGTLSPQDGVFMLMVSASTERPLRFKFDRVPDAQGLRTRLEREIPTFFDDVHGNNLHRFRAGVACIVFRTSGNDEAVARSSNRCSGLASFASAETRSRPRAPRIANSSQDSSRYSERRAPVTQTSG